MTQLINRVSKDETAATAIEYSLIAAGISGLAVFLALSNQREPRAGHIEKGAFALGIIGLLCKPNALSRVRPIFSSVWHTQSPNASKDISAL